MNIEKEIAEIKARNVKVDLDKKWETSWMRKVFIMIVTFAVILPYNLFIWDQQNVVWASLIPPMAYLLSTLSLDLIRDAWEKKKENSETVKLKKKGEKK
ncbi:hypothetical protein FWF74_02145 [Candidatus Saccharibacteria bacterium]|nr:hypothetical protein [Candidatus Saccharibacteria bacterium]MCL1963364.1 hypothetical protein [Candidatus Saccharibacteria bacterium]